MRLLVHQLFEQLVGRFEGCVSLEVLDGIVHCFHPFEITFVVHRDIAACKINTMQFKPSCLPLGDFRVVFHRDVEVRNQLLRFLQCRVDVCGECFA